MFLILEVFLIKLFYKQEITTVSKLFPRKQSAYLASVDSRFKF